MTISSMRGRLTAVFALALAIVMALVCWGLIAYARFAEERSAETVLRMGANKVRQEFDEESAALNPDRVIKQEVHELGRDGLLVWAAPAPGSTSGGPAADSDMRTLPFTVAGQRIVVGLPWERVEERLRSQAAALAALSMFGVVMGTLGAWFLVGKTLSPIGALSAEAGLARVDHLQVHLRPPSSDTEIVHLVSTLNGLLERLARAASVQSRFYSAASHELRTPLHTLSGHLEVGLSRERTNAEYRAAMEEAYRQTIRLASLVQDLLLLTRLNTTAIGPATERVDIADLFERVRSLHSDRISQRGLHVAQCITGNAMICAPPNHAEMIIRNLFENAVNYASTGGTVDVSINGSNESVRLDIFNQCEPLTISDTRQLLEPFFRPDAARSYETGGNGLGLAICDAISRANSWELTIAEERGGFRASVQFTSAGAAAIAPPGHDAGIADRRN